MIDQPRILIVDDDVVDRRAIKRCLSASRLNAVVFEAASAGDAVATLRAQRIDCVLLDYRLPDSDGLDILQDLSLTVVAGAPVIIMITGSGSEQIAVDAMKLGADDYLVKEHMSAASLERAISDAVERMQREREADAANAKLKELALVDTLTQLGNRHLFEMRLEHALQRASRQSEALCVMLMDLDGFKDVNDTLGHAAGDEVLREMGRRLKAIVRDGDTVARFGGDEFVIIVETGNVNEGARLLLRRIENYITRPIRLATRTVTVGASIGMAFYPHDGADASALVQAADAAMYADKRDANRQKLLGLGEAS